MEQRDLDELLELERKQYSKMTELMETTRELAEAVERQDQVSIDMLISMRQKPLLEAQEVRNYIALKRMVLGKEDVERFDYLVSGGATNKPEEQPVAEQIAMNLRLGERLVDLDRRVNKRLCGPKSCYTD